MSIRRLGDVGVLRGTDVAATNTVTGRYIAGEDPEEILRDAVWWIDAAHAGPGQVVPNLGWGGSALNATVGSTNGTDSNDPKYLDWDGVNYVYTSGVSGNFLSVPDENALDISGDIDIRLSLALDNWSPASDAPLLSKWGSFQDSFILRLQAGTGRLQLLWKDSGAVTQTRTSTVSVGVSNESQIWIRATLDVNNGSSGHDVIFYTSTNGVTWTQLGSTVTTAGTTDIATTTSSVTIGDSAGKFYRAQILNGINGTLVLDVDTSVITSGAATSFTARTGQTVTINRSTSGRKSVAVVAPCWLFGTDDYLEVPDNDLLDPQSGSFSAFVFIRRWPYAAGNFPERILSKRRNASPFEGWQIATQNTTTLMSSTVNDGTTGATAADMTVSVSGVAQLLTLVLDRSVQTIQSYVNGTAGGTTSTSSVGSINTSLPLRVGRTAGGNDDYADLEFISAAIFQRALSASEINAISTYYLTRSGYALPRNDSSMLIRSANGTRYQLTIDDDGSLTTTAL